MKMTIISPVNTFENPFFVPQVNTSTTTAETTTNVPKTLPATPEEGALLIHEICEKNKSNPCLDTIFDYLQTFPNTEDELNEFLSNAAGPLCTAHPENDICLQLQEGVAEEPLAPVEDPRLKLIAADQPGLIESNLAMASLCASIIMIIVIGAVAFFIYFNKMKTARVAPRRGKPMTKLEKEKEYDSVDEKSPVSASVVKSVTKSPESQSKATASVLKSIAQSPGSNGKATASVSKTVAKSPGSKSKASASIVKTVVKSPPSKKTTIPVSKVSTVTKLEKTTAPKKQK